MRPTYGSLFSGIGGLDLGLDRAGWACRWQVERYPFCVRILEKHWPNVTRYDDVNTVDWSTVEPVDLVCGGFPCQPFSSAGLRRGADDERYLWPPFARAIGVLRPRLVLLENVPGLLRSPEFGIVLGDLADLGYDAEWSVVSACAVGAPHTRERVFVLAYPAHDHVADQVPRRPAPGRLRTQSRGDGGPSHREGWWVSEPAVDRMADGVPIGVVRGPLSALGNAVVPQVAERIGHQLLTHLGVSA